MALYVGWVGRLRRRVCVLGKGDDRTGVRLGGTVVTTNLPTVAGDWKATESAIIWAVGGVGGNPELRGRGVNGLDWREGKGGNVRGRRDGREWREVGGREALN